MPKYSETPGFVEEAWPLTRPLEVLTILLSSGLRHTDSGAPVPRTAASARESDKNGFMVTKQQTLTQRTTTSTFTAPDG